MFDVLNLELVNRRRAEIEQTGVLSVRVKGERHSTEKVSFSDNMDMHKLKRNNTRRLLLVPRYKLDIE